MKHFLLSIFLLGAAFYGSAQVTVYAKFTPFSSGTSQYTLIDENPNTAHTGEILISTVTNDQEQVLNIGSTTGGTGAGRVQFNPITFTRPVSVNSATFFVMMCAGAAFQKVEFTYYNALDQAIYKETLKLVAFSTIQKTAASCTTGCPGVIEKISMEYGALLETNFVSPGNYSTAKTTGWNRIKNTSDTDPNAPVN